MPVIIYVVLTVCSLVSGTGDAQNPPYFLSEAFGTEAEAQKALPEKSKLSDESKNCKSAVYAASEIQPETSIPPE